jgi:hypothetical protein
MTLIRISITIARELVKAIDRRARELDRSRSWVIGDAARRYLEAPGVAYSAARDAKSAVREPASSPHGAREVAEARSFHLQASLALPLQERLRRAEELVHLARQVRPRSGRHQVIGFDSYEDYYDWKKGRLVGR